MIFLIQYKRSRGEMIRLEQFSEAQRQEAEEARLALELSLMAQKDSDEVCLLEASNIEALERTHGRYFKDLTALVEKGSKTVESRTTDVCVKCGRVCVHSWPEGQAEVSHTGYLCCRCSYDEYGLPLDDAWCEQCRLRRERKW